MTIKIIPLISKQDIILTSRYPEELILVVDSLAFSESTLTLPTRPSSGKRFEISIKVKEHTYLVPPMSTEFVTIIIPSTLVIGASLEWKLCYGQKAAFTYTASGWVPDAGFGYGDGDSGIATGNEANGATRGTAYGYQADAHNRGVAYGESAAGINQGSALGRRAKAADNSVAVGSSARSEIEAIAIGYQAIANEKAIAIGHQAFATGLVNVGPAIALGYKTNVFRYGEEIVAKSEDNALSRSILSWSGDTSTDIPTELFLMGVQDKRFLLNCGTYINLNNTATMFKLKAVAAQKDFCDTVAAWEISGAIKLNASTNTVSFVGVPSIVAIAKDSEATNWDLSLELDQATSSMVIKAVGAISNIRWHIIGDIVEVRM